MVRVSLSAPGFLRKYPFGLSPILGFTDVHRWCYDLSAFYEWSRRSIETPSLRCVVRDGVSLWADIQTTVGSWIWSVTRVESMSPTRIALRPSSGNPKPPGMCFRGLWAPYFEQRTYDHVSPGSVSQEVKVARTAPAGLEPTSARRPFLAVARRLVAVALPWASNPSLLNAVPRKCSTMVTRCSILSGRREPGTARTGGPWLTGHQPPAWAEILPARDTLGGTR